MITLTKNDSRNAKLGEGVRATYRKVGETCPQDCSLLETGVCYAMKGPVAIHSKKSGPSHEDADALLEYLQNLPGGKKIRHHVSGDFFENDQPDWKYISAMIAGHADRPDLQGWVYTHGWDRLPSKMLNAPESLTTNASCDTLEEAQEAYDQGWPTVVVVDEDSDGEELPDGTPVVICPNQTDGLSCSECELCMQKDRNSVVGFREH